MCFNLLGFGNEFERVVPVLQQVGGLLIVHSDVMVLKHPGKEVVYLPGHVQDVTHSIEEIDWLNKLSLPVKLLLTTYVMPEKSDIPANYFTVSTHVRHRTSLAGWVLIVRSNSGCD